MMKHQISLKGPATKGVRISANLLSELLEVLTDGTKGALRLRLEGRSSARGTEPSWLNQAADFDVVGFREGSTVIQIEAPTLLEAAPERFQQLNFVEPVDTNVSAFRLFEQSLQDAIEGCAESDRFDEALLKTYQRLEHLFANGIETFELTNGLPSSPGVSITPAHIERVQKLRKETPPPQAVRIAGSFDSLRHSDRIFELILESGQRLRGVAPYSMHVDALTTLFGKQVVVVGTVVFRPSGTALRIEATKIEEASGNTALWSKVPSPQKHNYSNRQLRVPQNEHSGINKIWGRWPGDETDEQVRQALAQ